MSFFRRNLQSEVLQLIKRLEKEKEKFSLPRDFTLWEQGKSLSDIDIIDAEIVDTIKQLHLAGQDDPSITEHLLESSRVLKEFLEVAKQQGKTAQLPIQTRQHVDQLIQKLDELLNMTAASIVKLRSGIKKSSYIHYAQMLIEEVRTARAQHKPIEAGSIANTIYAIMTQRRAGEDIETIKRKYSNTHVEMYIQALIRVNAQIVARGKCKTKDIAGDHVFGVWFYITPTLTQYHRQRFGLFKITYKEYFSVIPIRSNVDGVVAEFVAFLESLDEISDKLYELSASTKDYIEAKVLTGLSHAISHPDSLVVHYQIKENGPKIRQIVEDSLAKRKVFTGRAGRIKTGFDFKPIAGGQGTSHSQIVAKVIADVFIEKAINTGYIETLTVEKLAERLKYYIEWVSTWPLETIHAWYARPSPAIAA